MTMKKANWLAIILAAALMFSAAAQAKTIYKYKDKNGTTVFVQDKSEIPPEYRDKATAMDMGGEDEKKAKTAYDNELTRLAKEKAGSLLDQLRTKQISKAKIARGKTMIMSFLRTERVLIGIYVAAGIVLFILATIVLKRASKNMMFKIAFKVVFIAGMMVVAFMYYMSYVSQNILALQGLDGKPGQSIVNPLDIVKQAKGVAGSMEGKLQETDEQLKKLDKELEEEEKNRKRRSR